MKEGIMKDFLHVSGTLLGVALLMLLATNPVVLILGGVGWVIYSLVHK
jgi:hypothetical protein